MRGEKFGTQTDMTEMANRIESLTRLYVERNMITNEVRPLQNP